MLAPTTLASCCRATLSSFRVECNGTPSATLWLVDGNCIDEDAIEQGKRALAPSEMRRFASFKRPERQRQYLIGRMLLRHAVSRMTGVPPASISTLDRPGAAPLLILPDGVLQPGFSLSHSREWIACTTGTDVQVGVDIEVIDSERNILALADAAFYPEEYAWFTGQNGSERLAAFYRMWTLKEALFKLLSVQHRQDEMARLIDTSGRLQSCGDRWFACFPQHAHLSISICSTQPLEKILPVTLSELAV